MEVKDKKQIYDKFITTHFGETHKTGTNEFGMYYKYFKKNYLDHLSMDKKSKILDIGCGMGHFLYFLKKEGYKNALGIDISKENVEFCIENGFNAKCSDIFYFLEENIDPFDTIVMNDIIEHFNKNEVIKILELVNQNLVVGGNVIIKTLNSSNPILANSGRYIDFTHEISFTEESLSQVLKVCTFEDIKIYPQNLYVFYRNPLNYVAQFLSSTINLTLRLLFLMYGRKTTKIFTKFIIAVAKK